MSFCIYFVIDDTVPDYITNQLPPEPYTYRGKNAGEEFMSYLVKIVNLIGLLLNNIILLEMTEEDITKFNSATHCEMCQHEFTLLYKPVKDHCHLSGCFCATLCNNFNLKRQN